MIDEAQVVTAFDAKDSRHRGNPVVLDWLRAHDIDPDVVVKAEVLLLDVPFIRLTEFVLDENGWVVAEDLSIVYTYRNVLLKVPPPEVPDA